MIPETKTVSAVLLDREGREIFRKDNVEVPVDWNPTSINIVSDKYLKKQESSVPVAYADISNTIFDKDPNHVEQYFPGIRNHLLDLMLNQMALFNSPVEFNFRPDSTHLQGSACFIFNIDDDMEHILSRTTDEARVYVYGSGHGSNYSKLREEDAPLSGGGKASGPLSFMIPGNAFAKTIKAGGKTRRAAKIVILDISHPDVEKFIDEKWHEENKAKHLINADPSLGVGGIESEAYNTVNGQNANYSVRLSDEFMRAVEDDKDWSLQSVLDDPPDGYDKVRKILPARQLFKQIATRAHQCGDPGLQFGTTVNKANPLYPEIEILGSNPCGEFYGVPDSACNLATINILKFIEEDGYVNWDSLGKAVETLIVAMDIIATIGWYPYEEMRVNTDLYRPLGLNITNFAAALMFKGMRYGSPESVSFAEAVMNFITQRAWDTSSKLSTYIGTHLDPYKDRMEDAIIYQNCVLNGPTPRNTQVTLIAPTGTVSFAMGADTTSIEPFFSLVSYKSMIGGGFLEIVPEIISTSLKRLGYDPVKGVAYIKANGNLKGFVSENHEPIFHTAMDGLTYEDHLAIQAAFQKHISGGISKTVNLPPDITVDEIENIYMKAWKMGLKGITVYRDGSKIFQPLSAKADKEEETTEPGVTLAQPYRVKPQEERLSITKKMTINGLEGYVTTGLYHNGEICEIFVELSKSGSTLNGFVNALCTFISIGIQHGVPLQVFIDKMEYTSFEPAGLANLDKEGHFMVSSILDYLAKYLKDLVERPEEHLHRLVDIHSKDEADDCEDDEETPSCEEPPRKESRPSNLLSNNYGTCDSCGNVSIKDGACFTCTVCGTNTGCG